MKKSDDPKVKALQDAVDFNVKQMARIEKILLSDHEHTYEEIVDLLRKEIFGE